ncbi:MAG: alpha/beta fold hydrolase [Planctomycetes bacterium]|nr:alpha/beta fold hydrolase [Planctomycetota bacterium]
MNGDAIWRPLYPFASNYLDRAGLRYHYLDEYTGPGDRRDAPAVVMVHGNPTWSFYFREIVKALRPTHRCIVPDHIGCGLSDKPPQSRYDYRLKSRIDDLETLLDHLQLERDVTMLVHDWGGMIGMGAALRRPDRISRLIITNTAAFLPSDGFELPWMLKLLHRDTAFAKWAVQGLNLFARGAAWTASSRGLPNDVNYGLTAPYNTFENRLATRLFVQDIPLSPEHPSYATAKWIDENLHHLADRPTLIMWGLQDYVFDARFLDEWRKRFPLADVHAWEDAGHYLNDDARDRVVELVLLHLNKVTRISSLRFEHSQIPFSPTPQE